MRVIDEKILHALSEEARRSPRKRKNLNLHGSYEEPCQRLLNALEPGTYVRPHRHLTPPKPECFLALRGRMAAILFSDEGEIDRVIPISPTGSIRGVDVPAGVWHAVVSLESGSVFFETKPGPYEPLSDKDWAPWAPEEGSKEAEAYLERLVEEAKRSLNYE